MERPKDSRSEFEGLRAVIVGAGRSGLGAAFLLERAGAVVTVNDRAAKSGPEIEDLRARGVRFVFGEHPRGIFEAADLVVLSPGVPGTLKVLEGITAPVVGELELATRFLAAPMVAVTGTNGKSTVVHLIHAMALAGGRDAVRCGNVGDAVSRVLWERGAGGPASWNEPALAVVEVSSFQLETIRKFHADVAVVLNLTPDHMDRYASIDEYRKAKERIFENQTPADTAVLNADDPSVRAMAACTDARIRWFSRRVPVEAGTWTDRDGGIFWNDAGGTQRIGHADDLGIKGVHNLENALAAAAATLATGVDVDAVSRTLRSFRGLPHRMELVRDRGGVTWVNDSKGTNVGAMVRSLESMTGPVLLIAGGRDKDGDFAQIRDLVRAKVRQLILIGEAAGKIEKTVGDVAEHVYRAGDLGEAVRYAAELAHPGDTVLLSPGCASFDQFRDFEDRGEKFRTAVEALGDA